MDTAGPYERGTSRDRQINLIHIWNHKLTSSETERDTMAELLFFFLNLVWFFTLLITYFMVL